MCQFHTFCMESSIENIPSQFSCVTSVNNPASSEQQPQALNKYHWENKRVLNPQYKATSRLVGTESNLFIEPSAFKILKLNVQQTMKKKNQLILKNR